MTEISRAQGADQGTNNGDPCCRWSGAKNHAQLLRVERDLFAAADVIDECTRWWEGGPDPDFVGPDDHLEFAIAHQWDDPAAVRAFFDVAQLVYERAAEVHQARRQLAEKTPAKPSARVVDEIRCRRLVVVDEKGVERIVGEATQEHAGVKIATAHGLRGELSQFVEMYANDDNGYEVTGLFLSRGGDVDAMFSSGQDGASLDIMNGNGPALVTIKADVDEVA